MKPSAEQLVNLLTLRREERPEDGYWQDFLMEFHHCQRQHALRKSPVLALWARLRHGFTDLGHSKWIYGAGLVYAALTVGIFLAPHRDGTVRPFKAPIHRELPVSAPVNERLERLELSPSTQGGTGGQIF